MVWWLRARLSLDKPGGDGVRESNGAKEEIEMSGEREIERARKRVCARVNAPTHTCGSRSFASILCTLDFLLAAGVQSRQDREEAVQALFLFDAAAVQNDQAADGKKSGAGARQRELNTGKLLGIEQNEEEVKGKESRMVKD